MFGSVNTRTDALAVANEFIKLGNENNQQDLTPLKLQKLCYFAHGWYLAMYSHPLIGEEVQAWHFGPVFASLYHNLKYFGNSIIYYPITIKTSPSNYFCPALNNSYHKSVVNHVFHILGDLSAAELVSITHAIDGPWASTYKNGEYYIKIEDRKIKQYFQNTFGINQELENYG